MSEGRKEIYRRDALDALAAADTLDRPLALVGAGRWLLLGAAAIAVVAGALWAATVSAPVKVRATGVLISPEGQRRIDAPSAGQLSEYVSKSGSHIKRGDAIAIISRPDLERSSTEAAARLADLKTRADAAEAQFTDSEARLRAVADKRLNALALRRQDLENQLAARTRIAEALKALLPDSASQIEYDNAAERVDATRAALRDLEQLSFEIEASAEEREAVRAAARFLEQQQIREQERETELLTRRIAVETRALAPADGVVIDLLANPGDMITAGAPIARMSLGDASSDVLEALLYAPLREGKKVRIGMDVELSPSTVERNKYGFLRGEVRTVSQLPSPTAAIMSVLQDERLAAELTEAGSPIEVRVRLAKTDAGEDRYDWSASNGPDTPLTEGTLIEADIIVQRKRLLTMLLPGAAR